MKRLLFAVLLLAAPATAQEKPFDWKIRPAVGSKWQVKNFVRYVTSQNIPDDEAVALEGLDKAPFFRHSYISTKSTTVDYDVLSRDKAGASTIQLTYRDMSIRKKWSINGVDKTEENEPLNDVINKNTAKAYIGTKLIIKVGPKGDIWNILGLEELEQKLSIMALTESEQAIFFLDPVKPRAQLMVDENFRNLAGLAGRPPAAPLSTGGTYSYLYPIEGAIPSGIESPIKRTLKSRVNGKTHFQDSAALDLSFFNPSSEWDIAWAMFKGVAKGKTVVDEANGLVKESNLTMRYHGTATAFYDEDGKRAVAIPAWVVEENRTLVTPRN